MKTLLISLLSFFADNQVDERLKIHVEHFIQEAQARGIELPQIKGLKIAYKPLNGMGGCWIQEDSTIWINSAHRMDGKAMIEMIVFHELAHAWLNRRHDDERTSLMNSKPAFKLYRKLRKEYLDELFLCTPVFR